MKAKKLLITTLTMILLVAATMIPLLAVCYADPGDGNHSPEAAVEDPIENPSYIKARVIDILKHEDRSTDYSGGSLEIPTQIVAVKIMEGAHKGEISSAEYVLTVGMNDRYQYPPLKRGNEVLVYVQDNPDGSLSSVQVVEIYRGKYMLYLTISFVLLLVLVGGLKGLKSVISLAVTAVAILKFMLPAIMRGYDPVWISVAVCAVVIIITMLLISGFNRKTLAAVLGTVGGVLAAGAIAIIVGNMAKLTGIGGDESQMLMYIPQNIYFDFKGLLFAGIIIGTMGANMDVGISIASSMDEIRKNNPTIGYKDLIKAGMNVGRDIMATMSNTLILAYTGGALHLMLLLMAYNSSFNEIISWDIISSEILRALAGSIGLVCTIPLTALISGAVEKRRVIKQEEEQA